MSTPGRVVALLRAVNVGGTGKLTMADLRAAAADSGLSDVATVLQSGTLIGSASCGAAELEHRLEATLAERLGWETEVIVRSAEDWRRLIEANPFAAFAGRDPAHLLVVALKRSAHATAEASLRGAVKGEEEVAVSGDAAYVTYPDGIGRSKLTMALIERHLGTRGTGRNWSTVLKIASVLATPPLSPRGSLVR